MFFGKMIFSLVKYYLTKNGKPIKELFETNEGVW